MILLRLPKLVWMGKVESYQVTLEKQLSISRSNSLLFRLAEDGIYALGKPHMRSIPSLRFFFPVSFETVPMFVWLTMALSRRFKEVCRALSLSTLVYSRRSMVQCPWLCARRWWLKLLNFPDLPRSRPLVSVAMAANLSTRSFPFTPVCPGQCTHRNFRRWVSTIATIQSELPILLLVANSLNLWGRLHVWSDCHLFRQSSGGHVWLLPPPLSRWSLRPYRLHCLHGW